MCVGGGGGLSHYYISIAYYIIRHSNKRAGSVSCFLKINFLCQITMYYLYAGTAMKTGVIQGLTRINEM